MKSFFSNIKKDMVGNALLFLLVGLILLVFPVSVSKIACYACGIILLFYGLQLLHAYFTMSFPNSLTLIPAILLLLCGCFVIVRYDLVISFIPFLMGIVFLFYGLRETGYALSLKNAGYEGWGINLLLSVLSLAGACVLLFYPFAAASFAVRFIGACLIYSGISQLWTIHCLSSHIKDFFR